MQKSVIMRSVKSLALGGLMLFGSLGVLKADLYNVNAVVGNNVGHDVPVLGITGLTLTGVLNINSTDPGGSGDITGTLTLEGDSNLFTGYFGCPGTSCTFFFNGGFTTFGILDLTASGSLFGYTGTPALLPASEITIGSNPFFLSGSVLPVPTPEPGFYGVLALGGVALAFALWRRNAA